MLKASDKTEDKPLITLSYISENAVLLEWPEKICAEQHQHIMFCQQQAAAFLKEIMIDSIASYASLIIYYKFEKIQHDTLNTFLLELIQRPIHNNNQTSASDSSKHIVPVENSIIEIPVYYDEEAGWDIQTVAQQTQLSIDEVIQLHSQTTYRAYALGFTPGFCYLGKLPAQLQLPRKSSPRLSVPKGAVAIAEQQTAIYPNTSPGGWHIIGQTPLDMYHVNLDVTSDKNIENSKENTFDKENNNSQDSQFKSTIQVGQSVRFISITRTEFLSLGGEFIKETR
ncbi:5-oxoprolinase subunit PxpB [Pseudocolwellia sp. HL-MZ7]|uniref:5-oxoprolinase subunit PxpB n=1 Tax=Pseudocolwellia sp. HL-MZ7 TaxID=3400627 RepID=UPI003CF1C9B9